MTKSKYEDDTGTGGWVDEERGATRTTQTAEEKAKLAPDHESLVAAQHKKGEEERAAVAKAEKEALEARLAAEKAAAEAKVEAWRVREIASLLERNNAVLRGSGGMAADLVKVAVEMEKAEGKVEKVEERHGHR